MAAERLSVRKVREVLRFHAPGLSRRDIGRSVGVSHNTAELYIDRAAVAGVSPAAVEALDDTQLEALLFAVPACPGCTEPIWPIPQVGDWGRRATAGRF